MLEKVDRDKRSGPAVGSVEAVTAVILRKRGFSMIRPLVANAVDSLPSSSDASPFDLLLVESAKGKSFLLRASK